MNECPASIRSSSTFSRAFAISLGLLLGFTLYPQATAAAECERRLPIELPIRFLAGVPLASLTVKNQPVSLVVDTGAERTILSSAASERLHLRPEKAYPRRLRSIGNVVMSRTTELPHLAVAGTPLHSFEVLVGAINLPSLDGVVPDGLLGADILSSFDVDLDLPRGQVRLYNRAPSCATPIGGWHRPYLTIDANLSLHDRLFFPAAIDGRKVAAIVDTGARHSVLGAHAARLAGVGSRELDKGPAATLRGVIGSLPAHVHRFKELILGGDRLPDPVLVVTPLNLDDADLILGLDFLSTRRVVLSYSSHRVLIEK